METHRCYIWVTSESCTGRYSHEDEAAGRVQVAVPPVQDDEVTHIYIYRVSRYKKKKNNNKAYSLSPQISILVLYRAVQYSYSKNLIQSTVSKSHDEFVSVDSLRPHQERGVVPYAHVY